MVVVVERKQKNLVVVKGKTLQKWWWLWCGRENNRNMVLVEGKPESRAMDNEIGRKLLSLRYGSLILSHR